MMLNYKIAIVTPCFNDQESCNQLIKGISTLTSPNIDISAFIIDDGSFPSIRKPRESHVTGCLIHLKTNLVHQKAIACGLYEVFNSSENFTHIVVMDSDGEDRCQDILRLIKSTSQTEPFVFAQRRKRQEAGWFKMGYVLYKIIALLLIGKRIRHGNFSAFNSSILERILYNKNVSINYAAAILTSKLPVNFVETDRGERFEGKSKMNPVGLIQHGLSAISVFQEVVLLRIGVFVGFFLLSTFVFAGFILYEKAITGQAILGWSSTILSILIVGAINAGLIVLALLLNTLSNRQNISATPAALYASYIKDKNTF